MRDELGRKLLGSYGSKRLSSGIHTGKYYAIQCIEAGEISSIKAGDGTTEVVTNYGLGTGVELIAGEYHCVDETNHYFWRNVVITSGAFTIFGKHESTIVAEAPEAPEATFATDIGYTYFTINFNTVAGADGYYLDVATDIGFTSMVSGFDDLDIGSVSDYLVTGLNIDTSYYYRVRAYNTFGTSASSNIVTEDTSIDDDYQAILTHATAGGFTLPSLAQRNLQNKLVYDLKQAGVWNSLDMFAVFATDGDRDFALIDWIPVSDMVEYNSPNFTANLGFKGNSTDAYIDTLFVPSTATNYQTNSASYGYYSPESILSNTTELGARDALGSNMSHDQGPGTLRVNTNNVAGVSTPTDAGFYIFQRNAALFVKVYYNGVEYDNDSSNAATGRTSYSMYALALNSGGTPSLFSGARLGIIYAGDKMNLVAAEFWAAIESYLDAI